MTDNMHLNGVYPGGRQHTLNADTVAALPRAESAGQEDNAAAPKNTPAAFNAILDAAKKELAASYAAGAAGTGGIGGGGRFPAMTAGISGDYLAPLEISAALKAQEKPIGAAANAGQKGAIDRTRKLYASALELESYFVKIMLSSMRNTISRTGDSGDNFAARTYEDMLYDQLSRTVTQNAGFGLADQVYLQIANAASADM